MRFNSTTKTKNEKGGTGAAAAKGGANIDSENKFRFKSASLFIQPRLKHFTSSQVT